MSNNNNNNNNNENDLDESLGRLYDVLDSLAAILDGDDDDNETSESATATNTDTADETVAAADNTEAEDEGAEVSEEFLEAVAQRSKSIWRKVIGDACYERVMSTGVVPVDIDNPQPGDSVKVWDQILLYLEVSMRLSDYLTRKLQHSGLSFADMALVIARKQAFSQIQGWARCYRDDFGNPGGYIGQEDGQVFSPIGEAIRLSAGDRRLKATGECANLPSG